jgi:hypothetical protein
MRRFARFHNCHAILALFFDMAVKALVDRLEQPDEKIAAAVVLNHDNDFMIRVLCKQGRREGIGPVCLRLCNARLATDSHLDPGVRYRRGIVAFVEINDDLAAL